MKISEKQLMQLMTVLYDSIRSRLEIDGMFSFSQEDRTMLYNQILRQQSEDLRDVTYDHN